MSQRRLISSIAVATAIVLCGCGSGDDSPSADSAATIPGPTSEVSTAATAPTSPSASAAVVPTTTPPSPSTDTTEEGTVHTDTRPVDIAIADLADRLDVGSDVIEIVGVEEVTWPDGALGCPEPGTTYTQALVDGSRIVLSVDGTEYDYHSGRSGVPAYCPAGRVRPPVDDADA